MVRAGTVLGNRMGAIPLRTVRHTFVADVRGLGVFCQRQAACTNSLADHSLRAIEETALQVVNLDNGIIGIFPCALVIPTMSTRAAHRAVFAPVIERRADDFEQQFCWRGQAVAILAQFRKHDCISNTCTAMVGCPAPRRTGTIAQRRLGLLNHRAVVELDPDIIVIVAARAFIRHKPVAVRVLD